MGVYLTILYTTVYSSSVAAKLSLLVSTASATSRSVAIHLEVRSSSTTLWALWWRSFYCLLILLVTPQCIATMQRKWASNFNNRWLAKLRCFQKWRGRFRWLSKPWPAALSCMGKREQWAPSRTELYASSQAQLICHILCFVLFYFFHQVSIAQLSQLCDYC